MAKTKTVLLSQDSTLKDGTDAETRIDVIKDLLWLGWNYALHGDNMENLDGLFWVVTELLYETFPENEGRDAA